MSAEAKNKYALIVAEGFIASLFLLENILKMVVYILHQKSMFSQLVHWLMRSGENCNIDMSKPAECCVIVVFPLCVGSLLPAAVSLPLYTN